MIFNKVIYGSVTFFDLLFGIIILIVGIMIAKVASIYLRRFLREKVDKDHLGIIVKTVYYTVIVIALIVTLPIFGIKPSGFLVAGGIIGVAVAFASQNIVSNLLSGIFLTIERPIKIGNSVNIDGTVGIVEDIRIMSTTLRTFDGLYIRLPNQKVFTANITNYVANIARRFEYVVGIRYRDDAEKAIKAIKDLIEEQPMALSNPEPLVFVNELGDSSVNIIIRIWAPVNEWYELKTQLLWKIKETLEREKIEIPFPQRVVWLPDEAQKVST